jgi:hypothetical protein
LPPPGRGTILPDPPEFDEEEEREALVARQPALAEASYSVTSRSTASYNCIAWAAGDNRRNWSPAPGPGGRPLGGYYWPDSVELLPAVSTVESVFRQIEFEPCDDGALVSGVEKIVIFGDAFGVASHAARQTPEGRWASKMGDLADIEHDRPEEVESGLYGTVQRYMSRCKKPAVIEEPRRLLLPPGR